MIEINRAQRLQIGLGGRVARHLQNHGDSLIADDHVALCVHVIEVDLFFCHAFVSESIS